MLSSKTFEKGLSAISHFLSGFIAVVLVNNIIVSANIGARWVITFVVYLLLQYILRKVLDFIFGR